MASGQGAGHEGLGARRDEATTFGAVDDAGNAYVIRAGSSDDVDALAELRRTVVAKESARARHAVDDFVAHAAAATELWREAGVTLVAERAGDVVAAARYSQIAGSTNATVALAAAELAGQRELGIELVTRLAQVAHSRGIEHFVADLHPSNAAMLAVFVRAGFATEIGVGDGVMHLCFSVDPASRDEARSQVRATPIWESTIGGCRFER